MGLLERMGLVEKVEEEIDYEEYEDTCEEELVEVNTDGVSQTNLIADIYAANDLSDESCSIFKAEQICSTLPATMTTETKKASVLGALGVFGLTAETLSKDALVRMNILVSAETQITNENVDIINEKKQEIEDAKKLIEQCEKTIAEHEKIIANSTDVIDAEIKRISDLNVFLGGEPFVGGAK